MVFPAEHCIVLMCPRESAGRVIGRGGKTIRALRKFTSCRIRVNEVGGDDASIVRIDLISHDVSRLHLASSMIHDIVLKSFRGFRVLYKATACPPECPRPTYVRGHGLVVRSESASKIESTLSPSRFPFKPRDESVTALFDRLFV
jgi:hypothetical protein